MKKFAYKNTSKKDLVLVGVGVVTAGDTISGQRPIVNPHLRTVEMPKSDKPKQDKKK